MPDSLDALLQVFVMVAGLMWVACSCKTCCSVSCKGMHCYCRRKVLRGHANTVKQLQSFHSGPELLSEATMLYSTLGRSAR